jgi:hypothetical protein
VKLLALIAALLRAWGTNQFSDADTVSSWGAGFRYLIARRLGIYMGVDIAKGPEDHRVLHPGRQRLAVGSWTKGQ